MHDSENISPTENRDRFTEHLEQASETVRAWPRWKQSVLGDIQASHTSSQTSSVNRSGSCGPTPDDAGDLS